MPHSANEALGDGEVVNQGDCSLGSSSDEEGRPRGARAETSMFPVGERGDEESHVEAPSRGGRSGI